MASVGDDARTEIRFSGSGGQGIILMAAVLADAAAATGREVVQTQTYGPEARGGASKAEVVISAGEIDFPEVTAPEVTVCLSQEAFARYGPLAGPASTVLYDSGCVDPGRQGGAHHVGIPFSELAEAKLGKAIAANIVALGALQRLHPVVPEEALTAALRRRVPAHLLELNLRAFALGLEAGQGPPISPT